MSHKETYRKLCQSEPSIPIFARDWWLDQVAGKDAWDVLIVEDAGQVIATMPYVLRKKIGLSLISQPPLTQTLGPWIRESESGITRKLNREKDLLQALVGLLPEHDDFTQCWHYRYTNWLPFYWSGFEQTTLYTYILSDLSNVDQIWKNFQENIRRECRKASNRFSIQVKNDATLEDFLKLQSKTFARQNLPQPYSDAFLKRLDSACDARHCRKIFMAVDQENRHHAGVYLVWDEESAYYLMGGGDPDLRNSGATSLCMWHAIQFAATVSKRFDFEGSMIEPIERFFRAFGAQQTPYFLIKKTSSKLLKLYRQLRP